MEHNLPNENKSQVNSQTFMSSSMVSQNTFTKIPQKSFSTIKSRLQKKNPKKYFIVKETQKIRKNYLNNIIQNEIQRQKKNYRAPFANKQNISYNIRARLVI